MKKIILFIFLTTFGLSVTAQELPSADAIFEKYFQARGGKAAIAEIKDMVVASTAETPRGTSESEVKYLAPNKVAMAVFANGMEIMTSKYDGTTLQRSSRFGGGQGNEPKTGDEAKMEALSSHPFAELNYNELGIKVAVEGKEKIGENDAFKIQVTAPNRSWTDYYDEKSGLKVKTYSKNKTPRGEVENVILYEDYQKYKGSEVLFPAIRKQTSPMGEITSEISIIKFNKGLKDKDFQ